MFLKLHFNKYLNVSLDLPISQDRPLNQQLPVIGHGDTHVTVVAFGRLNLEDGIPEQPELQKEKKRQKVFPLNSVDHIFHLSQLNIQLF